MNLFGTTYSAQQQGGIYSTYRPEHNPIASAFLGMFFFAVAIAAYPMKLFFRTNMGERAIRIVDPFVYLGAFFTFGSEISMWTFFINSIILSASFKADFSWIAVILSLPLLSLTFSIWLSIKSYKYFKNIHLYHIVDYAQRVHSFYRGESKYFQGLIGKSYKGLTISLFHIQLFLEPITTIFLGLAFLFLDTALGIAIILGGICLFVDEWEVIRRRRDMVLDVLDAEMDAAFVDKGRNQFRRLEEQDVDLKKIEMGFEIHKLLIENATYTIEPPTPLCKIVLDEDIR